MSVLRSVLAFLQGLFAVIDRVAAAWDREQEREAGRNQVKVEALNEQAQKADENARISARRDSVDVVAGRMRDGSF